MSGAGVRLGVGTRFRLDGETVEVVEVLSGPSGTEVLLKDGRDRLLRMSARELVVSGRARIITTGAGPASDDLGEPVAVTLAKLTPEELTEVVDRAAHVRELLTGFRSGSAELAAAGEPRPEYEPKRSMSQRYVAKAAELGVGVRTVERWVAGFRANGEAGLVLSRGSAPGGGLGRSDPRWVETALEVMAEYEKESKPSRKHVLERIRVRLDARFGPGEVPGPSRTTAYRWLEELEQRLPTFRLSTKRNQDIAARPGGVYGKLRPTRPGEYLLMDTTRLDVFALDRLTLRWMQAELTVAMDWYTRCITGIRVTPVSTKAADAAAVLFQTFRPRPAGASWPDGAAWPEHGIPRTVLVDREAVEAPSAAAAGPAIVPETLVVDHGKIYLSEHLTSVCQRLGISIQPARLRTGRDKGPVERFFRTLREDLLQTLPGYKGPDLYSRGSDPEGGAFFFHHELAEIICEWVAVDYHRRPHGGLMDPHVPGLELSPTQMFDHGLARAGYIEVPRDADLAYEFLKVHWRTVQHYGVEIGSRRYNGAGLDPYRSTTSPHGGKAKGRWPIAVDPDDVTRAYFRDPADNRWHTLWWEHAPSLGMPMSDEALAFARRLAAQKYPYPNDELAVAELLERWNLGLGDSLAERRMALRVARDQASIVLPGAETEPPALPSVARLLDPDGARSGNTGDSSTANPDLEVAVVGGDDDEDEDLEDDFYADTLEDL